MTSEAQKEPSLLCFVAASVLQRHIQTMAVERQRPTMTLMVIASAPAAVGNVTEFHS